MAPKKRRLDRKVPHLRDTSMVIIATEGAITEKLYFGIFRGMYKRVQVKVLETADGCSGPRHVLNRLREFKREFGLDSDDALCLVIDYDRWGTEQLAEVAAEARKLGVLLAISRPCFEIWLYLHFAEPTPDLEDATSKQLKIQLRRLVGGDCPAERVAPYVDDAMARARALDTRPEDRWPQRLGTRVYRVIEAIRERS